MTISKEEAQEKEKAEEKKEAQDYRLLLHITPREYSCLLDAFYELGYDYEEL